MIVHGYGGNLDFNGSKMIRDGESLYDFFPFVLNLQFYGYFNKNH